jgi:hypothetical protein
MDISSTNSTGGLYFASLTSPFIGRKPVTINAYNSFNPAKPAEGSFSRSYFDTKPAVYNKIDLDAPSARFKSAKNFVENSISAGMSPIQAIEMYKAQRTYGLSSLGVTSGVYRMRTGYTI